MKRELFDSARPFEVVGTATIDLDEVVRGDWTEVLILCRGVEPATVDAALGFPWGDSASVTAAGFAAMLVFSTGESVESYASFGQDKFVADDLYVSPCGTESPGNSIAVIRRDNSEITFDWDEKAGSAGGWRLSRKYSESLNWME